MSIDRSVVVSRHDPLVTAVDPATVLAVGNGQFAFSPDVTGFQSLNASYGRPFPLGTMSDWMWHSAPFPNGVNAFEDFEYTYFPSSRGAPVPYPLEHPSSAAVTGWLRANPHRLDMGQVALRLMSADGLSHRALHEEDLTDVRQQLSLWTGALESSFELLGGAVNVTTTAHPELDSVGWQLRSSAALDGRLAIRLAFPYGSSDFMRAAEWAADPPGRNHTTDVVEASASSLRLSRRLDYDSYEVRCDWASGPLQLMRDGPHAFVLPLARGQRKLDLSCLFAPPGGLYPLEADAAWQLDKGAVTRAALLHGVPSARSISEASAAGWASFWQSGAFVDLASAGGDDPRAKELERRVVLSQYLTRLHSAGALPPQETGLAANSWYGKCGTPRVLPGSLPPTAEPCSGRASNGGRGVASSSTSGVPHSQHAPLPPSPTPTKPHSHHACPTPTTPQAQSSPTRPHPCPTVYPPS